MERHLWAVTSIVDTIWLKGAGGSIQTYRMSTLAAITVLDINSTNSTCKWKNNNTIDSKKQNGICEMTDGDAISFDCISSQNQPKEAADINTKKSFSNYLD